jgi:hypothetical protein
VVIAHYDNSLKNEHLQHHHGASDVEHRFGPDKEVYFRAANQSWDEMFTPFIQYSTPTPNRAVAVEQVSATQPQGKRESPPLPIVEVVGCLEQAPSGIWMLTNAGEPAISQTQPTSQAALTAAAAKPLGHQREQLLGVDAFNPSSHKAQKVVVKGVLIKEANESRLNVTSLQTVAEKCF